MNSIEIKQKLEGKGFGGLELILSSEAKVFYETVFSLHHIGRITDLFMYEMRGVLATSTDSAEEEARVRRLLEFTILTLWAEYREGEKLKILEVECGFESNKIACSVSGFVSADVKDVTTAQNDQDSASYKIYKLICDLKECGANVVVRHITQVGYFHIIFTLNVGSAVVGSEPQYLTVDPTSLPANADTAAEDVVKLPLSDDAQVDAFKVEENIEITKANAVNDQVKLGQDSPIEQKTKLKLMGAPEAEEVQTVVSGGDYADSNEKIVVSGHEENADSDDIRIAASLAEIESRTLVKGSGSTELDNEAIRIAGGDSDVSVDDAAMLVKGGNSPSRKGSLKLGATGTGQQKTAPLRGIGGVVGSESSESSEEDSDTMVIAGDQSQDGVDSTVFKISGSNKKVSQKALETRKVLESKNKKLSTSDESILKVLQNSSSPEAEEIAELLVTISSDDESEQSSTKVVTLVKDLSTSTQNIDDVSAEVDRAVAKSDKEFSSQISIAEKVIEKLPVPDKAKEYITNSLTELTKNRAELDSQIKEINSKWRSAQLEFKNKQATLSSEIDKLNIQLKSKEVSLEKSKEALSRTLKSMEDYKQKAESSHDAESAHKLNQVNVLLSRSKDYNEKMKIKMDELQKKLSLEMNTRTTLSADNSKLQRQIDELNKKMNDSAKAKNTVKEDPALRSELDRSNKQVEEMRKQQKMLQEKLAQAHNPNKQSNPANSSLGSKSDGPRDPELKLRLEQTQKMHSKLKEDYEKKIKLLDETRQNETKLRVELGKLQTELKVAQKGTATKKAS